MNRISAYGREPIALSNRGDEDDDEYGMNREDDEEEIERSDEEEGDEGYDLDEA